MMLLNVTINETLSGFMLFNIVVSRRMKPEDKYERLTGSCGVMSCHSLF
jgi:hypothetical protein